MTNTTINFILLKTSFLTGVLIASISSGFAQQSPNNLSSTLQPATTGASMADERAVTNIPTKMPSAGGDYTRAEKVAQKNYKALITHYEELIAKDERIMKGGNASSKTYKKAKIVKEIAEKNLADLKANCPFPDRPETKKASN